LLKQKINKFFKVKVLERSELMYIEYLGAICRISREGKFVTPEFTILELEYYPKEESEQGEIPTSHSTEIFAKGEIFTFRGGNYKQTNIVFKDKKNSDDEPVENYLIRSIAIEGRIIVGSGNVSSILNAESHDVVELITPFSKTTHSSYFTKPENGCPRINKGSIDSNGKPYRYSLLKDKFLK
jgi:hypothetical protein